MAAKMSAILVVERNRSWIPDCVGGVRGISRAFPRAVRPLVFQQATCDRRPALSNLSFFLSDWKLARVVIFLDCLSILNFISWAGPISHRRLHN